MPKHKILPNGNVAMLHTRRSLAESSDIWWRSSCDTSRQRGDDNSRETNHQFGCEEEGVPECDRKQKLQWQGQMQKFSSPKCPLSRHLVPSVTAFEAPMWSMESLLPKGSNYINCRNRRHLTTGPPRLLDLKEQKQIDYSTA